VKKNEILKNKKREKNPEDIFEKENLGKNYFRILLCLDFWELKNWNLVKKNERWKKKKKEKNKVCG